MEAQRYPGDYNGILGGAPANNRTHLHTVLISSYKATHQSPPATGYIPATKLDSVNQAVLSQCLGQANGPKTDTFLTDPRVCRFNPAFMQCPGNVDAPGCLTSDQISAMQAYYQGSVDPVTGAIINPGNERGAETSSVNALGFAYNENSIEPAFDSLFKWVFGPTWQWQTFNFDTDVAAVDQALGYDLNATATDMSAFENLGGKLILYHGWADPLIPAIDTVNYYTQVAETMFGGGLAEQAVAQLQGFAMLYMAPGMWHCGASIGAGPGPNSFGGMIQEPAPSFDPQHDLLSALTQWVENGVAPGPVIATKYVGDTPQLGIAMQRPICVFPDVAEYNGTGDPTLPSNFKCVSHGAGYNWLTLAHDFNGDGRSDILWRDVSNDVAMWLMDAGQIASAPGAGTVAGTWTVAGTADFNADGKRDILWQDGSGDVTVWLMNGGKIASVVGFGSVSAGWKVIGTGDFNGDGYADILWQDAAGDIALWFMNGSQILSGVSLGNTGNQWTVAGTGDFDGNGTTDILWRDTSGDVAIWFMNAGGIAGGASLGNVPTAWSVAAVGDFDGDGKSDILWRDSSGDLTTWFMNGGQIASGARVGNIPTAWSVIQAGDFDGDGKSDILWRDTGGDLAVWFMNGAQIVTGSGLGNVSGTWAIQAQNGN